MPERKLLEKAWDNWLLVLTFFSFLALGLISLGGTVFSWWKSAVQIGWEKTWLYSNYLNSMNILALPFALSISLLVVLCLPKRLTSKKTLIYWLLATIFCSLIGLAFYGEQGFLTAFFGSSLIASVFIVCLFLIRPKQVKFQKEGNLYKLGSLFLHLGYLLFLANLAIFYNSPFLLRLFWIAFALIVAGNLLILCPDKKQKQ